jgi:hypothetical protein
MPGPNPIRIFISYAHADGTGLSQQLVRDLAARGFKPWLDKHRLHGGAVWTKEIENAIDQAEVVLALLTRGSYLSEICRAEQLRSLRKEKCVIPLLAQTGADVPLHLEARQYLNFTVPGDYLQQFESLLKTIEARDGVVLKPEYRTTHNNAPALPENFVPRPDVLEALRNILFAESRVRHIALTALDGMGGIGKTVLAQALCFDEAVQQAFPDGIFWVPISRESREDFVSRVRSIPALNQALGKYDDERGCINQYRNFLRTKSALIVLDDVWDARDVELFRADSPRSRLLFTTRDTSIAATVGAREFTANLLTEEQSRAFLAQWSGQLAAELPPQADDLIQECGRLPLALSMIGASLRDEGPAYWKDILDLLRHSDLRGIEDYLHHDLFRVIQVSVDQLDAKTRERYLALAVLLEDMTGELPVLQTLWNAGEPEARRTAKYLASRSLATRVGDSGALGLHDLQLDYIRAQSPLRESLPLIHGAMRLSAHVVSRDPHQFASQVAGRLLPYEGDLPLGDFLTSITEAAPRPWFRPLYTGLAAPGGALIRTLTGHSDFVYGVAVSADGRHAVSASWDKTLKVWELDSGKEIITLAGHTEVFEV